MAARNVATLPEGRVVYVPTGARSTYWLTLLGTKIATIKRHGSHWVAVADHRRYGVMDPAWGDSRDIAARVLIRAMDRTLARVYDLDSMVCDERWLGYGWIGARRNALLHEPDEPDARDLVEAADAYLLRYAAGQGWSRDDLFRWANSGLGRMYGEIMIDSDHPTATLFARCVKRSATGEYIMERVKR